jgi:hypothetical protein
MKELFNKLKNNPKLIESIGTESEDIEFKKEFWWETEDKNWKLELAKDFSSMINRGGGLFIIGVINKDNNFDIIGIREDLETVRQKIAQITNNHLEPKFVVNNIEYIKYTNDSDQKIICLIEVPSFEEIGVTGVINRSNNNLLEFWQRSLTHKFPISYRELENMFFYKITGINYAKFYLEDRLEKYRKEYIKYYPLVVIQTIPLNFREDKWLLNNEEVQSFYNRSFQKILIESTRGYERDLKEIWEFSIYNNDIIYNFWDNRIPLGLGVINHCTNNKNIKTNFVVNIHKNGYISYLCLNDSKFFYGNGEKYRFDINSSYWHIFIKFSLSLSTEFYKNCNKERFMTKISVLKHIEQKIECGFRKDLIEDSFYDILDTYKNIEENIKLIENYIPMLWGF